MLLAIVVHAPLLLMQIPLGSYDANTHIFFASHYANHWFNPWNDKWYGGFTQTTYRRSRTSGSDCSSHVLGLNFAYMFVQLVGIVLLVIGVYRFSKLWVSERAASYAAIGSIFRVAGDAGLPVRTVAHDFCRGAYVERSTLFLWMDAVCAFSALLKGIAIGATRPSPIMRRCCSVQSCSHLR